MTQATGIVNAWTTALRSGEYEQGQGALRTPVGHCCLGVLADVLHKQFPDVLAEANCRWMGSAIVRLGIGDWEKVLPLHLWDDATRGALRDLNQGELAQMNDKGVSFAEIADHIEGALRPEASASS